MKRNNPTIGFIHPHKSFLPGIDAYTRFFSSYDIETRVLHPREQKKIRVDIAWHFLGWDLGSSKNAALTIHEYCSASTPPFRGVKDFLKQKLQRKPDFRIYLNDYVCRQFGFQDGIPFGFRDLGVDSIPADPTPHQKKYDFIYAGSIHKQRSIGRLIKKFTEDDLRNHSLLILSRDYEELKKKFGNRENIMFRGPVPRNEVSEFISSARYAINWMPDREPFNRQSSAKFLDYASLRVPVISSDYSWIRDFQTKYGGKYFFLEKGLGNLTWSNIQRHAFAFPDLGEWTWEKQIRRSGVLQFLASRFEGLKFD